MWICLLFLIVIILFLLTYQSYMLFWLKRKALFWDTGNYYYIGARVNPIVLPLLNIKNEFLDSSLNIYPPPIGYSLFSLFPILQHQTTEPPPPPPPQIKPTIPPNQHPVPKDCTA